MARLGSAHGGSHPEGIETAQGHLIIDEEAKVSAGSHPHDCNEAMMMRACAWDLHRKNLLWMRLCKQLTAIIISPGPHYTYAAGSC